VEVDLDAVDGLHLRRFPLDAAQQASRGRVVVVHFMEEVRTSQAALGVAARTGLGPHLRVAQVLQVQLVDPVGKTIPCAYRVRVGADGWCFLGSSVADAAQQEGGETGEGEGRVDLGASGRAGGNG